MPSAEANSSTLVTVSRDGTPSASEVTSMPLTNCCRSSAPGKPAASSAGVIGGRASMSALVRRMTFCAASITARRAGRIAPDSDAIIFMARRPSRAAAGSG